MEWPLRRAGISLQRVGNSAPHSDEWRQTGHCALLVALISALAVRQDHHLSRPLMEPLIVGYTVLAGALYAEGRRKREAPSPTPRIRYGALAGLIIALAAMTLIAFVSSL